MQRVGTYDSRKSSDPMDIEKEYSYDNAMSSNKTLKRKYSFSYFNQFKSKFINLLKIKKFNYSLRFLVIIPIFIFIYTLIHQIQIRKDNSKIVIILAVNDGGGVERWKTPEEWSVERSSIANKKAYAEKHGYKLTLKDTSLKKRYSHEWREGWEKADIIKQTMREYPNAEWFWWLDMYTFIMEPEINLYDYLLKDIEKNAYRSLSYFNPLKISVDSPYVNTKDNPVNLIVSQDCGGFNLGSFFIRRSEWSDLLLDAWWDPALYEQFHMVWEHKEQDCLEMMYDHQSWIRESLAFVPLKAINAFPHGACWEEEDNEKYFYDQKDRDFLVNMGGCMYGDRSCWNEYEHFRNLKDRLHRPWYKFW
jgi:mannan polymerase II complex MNN10 subunit